MRLITYQELPTCMWRERWQDCQQITVNGRMFGVRFWIRYALANMPDRQTVRLAKTRFWHGTRVWPLNKNDPDDWYTHQLCHRSKACVPVCGRASRRLIMSYFTPSSTWISVWQRHLLQPGRNACLCTILWPRNQYSVWIQIRPSQVQIHISTSLCYSRRLSAFCIATNLSKFKLWLRGFMSAYILMRDEIHVVYMRRCVQPSLWLWIQ